MPIITTDHLKLYQGKSDRAEVLVVFGHGLIGEDDDREFTPTSCTLRFYVDEGYVCLVTDNDLAGAIEEGQEPRYTMGDDEPVPDYWISKYRGRAGHEEGNHYSDNYYLGVSANRGVDILRARHRWNNKKKRLSDIVEYAEEQGYDEVWGLHCRFREKSFAGELSPAKKQKQYLDGHRQRPKYA